MVIQIYNNYVYAQMSDTGTSERVVLVLLRFMYILIIHFCICIFSAFVPLNELINSLSPEMLCKWERLWMVSDRREGVVHPLVYPHPVTGLKVRIHIIIVNLYNPVSLICYELSLWFQSGLYVFRLRYLNIFLLYLVKPFLQYRTIQGTYNLYQDFKWFCNF
jgi:hypothetical protein